MELFGWRVGFGREIVDRWEVRHLLGDGRRKQAGT